MNWRFWLLVAAAALLSLYAQVSRADTVSCDGKRGWQRQIVRDSVGGWFRGEPRPDDLISLVQAEHGIAACASLAGRTARLHTPTLPRGLELDRLGALLLANELEWSGLVPRPEDGLVGEFFRVRRQPAPFGEVAVGDARP